MDHQEDTNTERRHRPSRVEKHHHGKVVVIVLLVLLFLLGGAYAGACAYLVSEAKLMPNTRVAGVELGGLTRPQAVELLEAKMDERFAALSVPFTCGGKTYTVSGTELTADIAAAVDEAWTYTEGSTITAPIRYLQSLERSVELTIVPEFAQSPAIIAQAEEDISNAMVETTYEVGEDSITFVKGVTGQAIETEPLEKELEERFQTLFAGTTAPSADPIEVPVITSAPAEAPFEAIYKDLFVAPVDAQFDKTTFDVIPSVIGVSYDIEAAEEAMDKAAEGGTVVAPLVYTDPKISTELLQASLFRDVLGTSSTKCAGPSNRWYNIDIAASRVNGTILLPGEVFSYNSLAGPYSESSGYRKAGAYVGGKSIDTTAGGICQLSSTIYWTTLKANLETVERSKHKYNSGYMPIVGTDATVYSDSIDFKFKNNTEFPIKVECYQDKNHNLHVTILGTDTTGIHGEPYSVTIETIPFKNTYKADASKVAPGGAPVRDTEYARYNGITVDVYQKLVDKNGNTVSTTLLYRNKYSVSNAVYYYNPVDAARLGINPETGLMTEVPVPPVPDPNATPDPNAPAVPGVTPAPGTDPNAPVAPVDPAAPVEPVAPAVTPDPNAVVPPPEAQPAA